ncbi:ecotin [Stutzerimonas kirkiae]|uniref:Ecotin n=1 Tax=Stutzerimonas kirkiae TaxID=2211392 RepID=A0A4Q9R8B3_9GAMM|nr:serine protease inhibitor ecotin [Stutzerimonas kirkiae]TBU96857.1 ecotin [Stutzerimonas kirkiae]TBV00546.1 ecotin [Stutzerimonas kirkiae]
MSDLKQIATLIACAPLLACASPGTELAPYPPAEAGHVRQIIQLEPRDDEASYKVELIIGKELEVDCNHHWFGGQLQEKTVSGWGYDYYQLDKLTGPMGTLMDCPGQAKKKALVTLGGDPTLVRYNSKLPIVVYTPRDVQVSYRIWSAAQETRKADQR